MFGVIAIAASYVLSGDLARWLVIAVGMVALLFAIYGLILPQGPIGSTNIDGANLESPMDTILHLVVAVWALYAALVARPAMMAGKM